MVKCRKLERERIDAAQIDAACHYPNGSSDQPDKNNRVIEEEKENACNSMYTSTTVQLP